MHIYIYTYIYRGSKPRRRHYTAGWKCAIVGWVFITGGCSGRGVQWMGVVLYSKLVPSYK